MSILHDGIAEYEYNPMAPPRVVGELATGVSGYIQVWEGSTPVPLASSGLTEISNTGKFFWSTSNLPVLTRARQQYHWLMKADDESASAEGDFILSVAPHAIVLPASPLGGS